MRSGRRNNNNKRKKTVSECNKIKLTDRRCLSSVISDFKMKISMICERVSVL